MLAFIKNALSRAVKLKNWELMESALNGGADAHYKEEGALFQALYYKNTAMTCLLLSREADATSRNGKFLAVTTEAKEFELLQMILDQPGVNVNARRGMALDNCC